MIHREHRDFRNIEKIQYPQTGRRTYVSLRELVRDDVEGGPLQVAHAGEPPEASAEVQRLVHPCGGGSGGGGALGGVPHVPIFDHRLRFVVQGVQPRQL